MGIEVATYVNQLDSTNPLGTDLYETAANHLRLIKAVLLATFPNLNSVVNATPAELNLLVGRTAIGDFPSGTKVMFLNTNPPAGWTLDTSVNDALVRVNSTGGSTGGSWASQSIAASTANHSLAVSEMPGHTHNYEDLIFQTGGTNAWYTAGGTTGLVLGTAASGGVNGGAVGTAAGHAHTFTLSTDATWRPAYVDAVVGIKT